jgi:hypothetical protein
VQPRGAATLEGLAVVSGRHGGHRRTTVAIVYGREGEPELVLCDPEGDPPGQRWLTVVLDDSPEPGEPSKAPVCVDCLLDEHPRLGRGLDVALEHGGARWVGDGEWVPAPELWDEVGGT